MSGRIGELLLILLLILLFFGAGKLPSVMKEFGKGIRMLRDGLKHGDDDVNDGGGVDDSGGNKKKKGIERE